MVSSEHTGAAESAVDEHSREAYCESKAAFEARQAERQAFEVLRNKRLGLYPADQAFLSAQDGEGYKDPVLGPLERGVAGPTNFALTDPARNDTITRQVEQQRYAQCLDEATQGEIAQWQRELKEPDRGHEPQEIALSPDNMTIPPPWQNPYTAPSQEGQAETPTQIAQRTGQEEPLPDLELMEPPDTAQSDLADLQPVIDEKGNSLLSPSDSDSGQSTRTAEVEPAERPPYKAGQVFKGVLPEAVKSYANSDPDDPDRGRLRINWLVQEHGANGRPATRQFTNSMGSVTTTVTPIDGIEYWCEVEVDAKFSSTEIAPCVPPPTRTASRER